MPESYNADSTFLIFYYIVGENVSFGKYERHRSTKYWIMTHLWAIQRHKKQRTLTHTNRRELLQSRIWLCRDLDAHTRDHPRACVTARPSLQRSTFFLERHATDTDTYSVQLGLLLATSNLVEVDLTLTGFFEA
jgi:hypothetical protein